MRWVATATVAALLVLVLPAASARAAGDSGRGRALFVEGCSSCHGFRGEGIHRRGPSLRDAGAAAADFYLSTGRMPLDDPGSQPERADPAYTREQIDDLVAYVASLGHGPRVPKVHPERGSLSEGRRAFVDSCAGCHQVAGRGGVVTGGFSPPLQSATAVQIGEAVRVGPYLMPAFGERQIGQRELDSIARYVLSTRHPDNRGGWGMFELGAVPEGMVAWLVAGAGLLVLIRLLGERAE